MKYYKMQNESSKPFMWQMIDEENNVSILIYERSISVHHCINIGEDWIPATREDVEKNAIRIRNLILKPLKL